MNRIAIQYTGGTKEYQLFRDLPLAYPTYDIDIFERVFILQDLKSTVEYFYTMKAYPLELIVDVIIATTSWTKEEVEQVYEQLEYEALLNQLDQ